MLSPECLTDLNFIMNHLIIVGGQYKQCMRDFKGVRDDGVAAFLRAEAMERYELSSDVGDYIQAHNDGKGVMYAAEPAPIYGKADVAALQTLVSLEMATVAKLDDFIMRTNERGSVVTMQYFVLLRNMCQYEYNEVKGVVAEIASIAADPGAMSQYNVFLAEKYKTDYDHINPCGYK